jgi:hypothetical protein
VAHFKTRDSPGRPDENHEKLKSILPVMQPKFKLGMSKREIQNINVTPREKNTVQNIVEWNQLLGVSEGCNEPTGSITTGKPLTTWTTVNI